MARFWIGCLAALVVGQAASAQITLGFIGDEGKFGKHNMPAYEWAKGNYDTTVIPVADVPGADLKQYGVVWWHDGDANPALAWDEGAGDTLVSYLEAGGTVLLSAGAEQLATSMGVESGVPRWYATAADAHLAGLVVRDDTAKHPVWKGLSVAAGDQIELTTVGYPASSDYYDKKFIDAVTLGDTWETGAEYQDRVGAFVEWHVGDGLMVGMGWRLVHFADDNKDLDMLKTMMTNVIEYLADNSAFLSVDAQGKVAATWGDLKR